MTIRGNNGLRWEPVGRGLPKVSAAPKFIMFVTYRGSILGVIGWQWRHLLFFTVAALAIAGGVLHGPTWVKAHLQLPGLPLGVIGGAIGIFVSFRTNSAYDRWWEGRKLWGALVNASRHFCSQVLSYTEGTLSIGAVSDLQVRLVRRHIAYVHVLRCLLRKQPVQDDPDVKKYVDGAELAELARSTNATHLLLFRQMRELQEQVRSGKLDLFHQQVMDETLRDIIDTQGGCERIKNTPFPRGYGYIAERLIVAFSVLLPMGLVHDMGWYTVPMSVLVCSGFLLISETGRVLEDPFTLFWPALPLSALSRTIELNLLERLGEKDLPPPIAVSDKGILM